MIQQRLGKPQFPVHWNARIMTADRVVREVVIRYAARGGVCVMSSQAISVGAQVNLEFFVNYRSRLERIRVRTTVSYCRVLADNEGVLMDLLFGYTSKAEMHVFNNVLQLLVNAAAG